MKPNKLTPVATAILIAALSTSPLAAHADEGAESAVAPAVEAAPSVPSEVVVETIVEAVVEPEVVAEATPVVEAAPEVEVAPEVIAEPVVEVVNEPEVVAEAAPAVETAPEVEVTAEVVEAAPAPPKEQVVASKPQARVAAPVVVEEKIAEALVEPAPLVAPTLALAPVADTTPPKATGKPESVSVNGRYASISYKLSDAGKPTNGQVDYYTINGVPTNLSDNTWSDANGIKPGLRGAVEGTNVLVVYDTAGNASEPMTFVLDTTGPAITLKPTSKGSDGVFQVADLGGYDEANVVAFILPNGVIKNVTPNKWSDHNGVTVGKDGVVEGDNTFGAVDGLGNISFVNVHIDTTKPVLSLPSSSLVGQNPYTFNVTQVEVNPAKTYVEIQQLVDSKWKKLAGQEFLGTNAFDFTIDPVALGLQHGVQTQLKVSTWDKAGNHTSATSPVTVDIVGPVISWQKQPLASYGIGAGFHVRPITNEVGMLKSVYIDSVAPENLVWSLKSDHKNFDTSNGSNQALWDSRADGQHVFIAVFADEAGNSTISKSDSFIIDRTAPVVIEGGEVQVWEEKGGGRTSVTLTFSEPVSGLPQGWYGSGTTWTKAFYNTKPDQNVEFVDVVGNSGTYLVTPKGAPVVIPEEETPGEETPTEEVPEEETPTEEETPSEEIPEETVPEEEIPTEEVPEVEVPEEEAPAEETPAEVSPEQITPVKETPSAVILGSDTGNNSAAASSDVMPSGAVNSLPNTGSDTTNPGLVGLGALFLGGLLAAAPWLRRRFS